MSNNATDFGEIIINIIDKLAGKGSDVKLSFQDLICEAGPIKAKLNGSIVLDVQYVTEKK